MLDVASFVRRAADVVLAVAVLVTVTGLASSILQFDTYDSSARMRWTLFLAALGGDLGWGALLACGGAGLRLWAARLELDVASRYDTED